MDVLPILKVIFAFFATRHRVILRLDATFQCRLLTHRIDRHTLNERPHVVFNLIAEIHRVDRLFTHRVTDLEMQMRSARSARVARIGYQVTLFDGEFVFVGINLGGEFLVFVLVLLHILGNLARKALQVGIHRGISIIMRDIQHVTITVWRHTNAADITIGHGIHFLAFHALCLDVEARMEMIGAKLAKGSGQINGDIQRLTVFRKLLSSGT